MIEKTKIVFAADLILIKIIVFVWQFQNSQTMSLKFKKNTLEEGSFYFKFLLVF